MQRPVMNPAFLDDAPPLVVGDPLWLRVVRLMGRAVGLLFTDLFGRSGEAPADGRPWYSRLLRSALYRIVMVPVLIAVIVGVLVTTATHPRGMPAVADPAAHGAYYDPVEFLSADGTRLESWLVPVVDARRILVEREDVLHKRYPAVVLVHDHGASRQQLLPAVAPLHEAGYVVLLLNLRGTGTGARVGSTFGLHEAEDVRAAVDVLRRRPFVDPGAVGVLGVGTGATACLLAAQQDPQLKTLIVDHPVRQFEDVLVDRIGPRQSYLAWVRPFCKWGFEMAYGVDAEAINLDRFSVLMRQRNCLLMDDPGETYGFAKPVRQQQMVEFLKKHLIAHQRTATLLRRDEVGRVDFRGGAGDTGPDAPGANEQAWPPHRSASELLPKVSNVPIGM